MTADLEKRVTIVEQKVEHLDDVPKRLNYIDRDLTRVIEKTNLLRNLVILILGSIVSGFVAVVLFLSKGG